MKRTLVAVVVLWLSLASAAAAQEKQPAANTGTVPPIEARVRKLWEAYKNKDKATLSAMLDGGFRQFEEGLRSALSGTRKRKSTPWMSSNSSAIRSVISP